jgi:hypothetical protein
MEVWRDEIEDEIDRINQTLPNTPASGKTRAIQEWITRVLERIKHYRSEHKLLVKEAMTLLELALWKAKLLNETICQRKPRSMMRLQGKSIESLVVQV